MAARTGQARSVDPVPLLRSDEIYDSVRADIVHGVLRPNQRLVEVELAARLGVSRTPVRESLQRLVFEGLVQRQRGGWVVHEHSVEEIRAIYEERAALEALYPPGDDGFDADADAQVALNERFHDGVIAAAGNSRLSELSRANRQYYFNHRIASRYD